MTTATPKTLGADWEIPADLSEAGRKAAEVLRDFAIKHDLTFTGGCKVFYSPTEWKARGEEYGTTSLLVIVYDGGSVRKAVSLDGFAYDLHEEFRQVLAGLGLICEECTCWYAAVYRA